MRVHLAWVSVVSVLTLQALHPADAAAQGAGNAVQERVIVKQVVVAAPLAQVWAAWTTREGVISFFAPEARIEPRPGGSFEVYFDPGAPAGLKGADGMRVLAVQPMKMLSFTWNAPPHLPEARAQLTSVVVRLDAIDERTTRIALHHSGWGDGGEWDRAHAYFDRAWGGVLGNLKRRFEVGPFDWAPWLAQLERARADAAARAASAASGTGTRP
jgi:uncharacterized protein YndB with AHSA1/START domain